VPALRFSLCPAKEVFPVIGATPGVIGTIQANEVIRYLLGTGDLLANRLLIWDGMCSRTEEIAVARNPKCPACGNETSGKRYQKRRSITYP